jgi:hypothetical protein
MNVRSPDAPVRHPLRVIASAWPWVCAVIALPFIHCKTEYSGTPGPVYLGEQVRSDGGLTLHLALAKNNAMATRLVVENKSPVPVRISKNSVSLRIGRFAVAHPVGEYGEYVYKRLRSAKRACEGAGDMAGCRQSITEYFMPFLSARPFTFGTIKPGESRDGAIAFDLLDPFTRHKKARRLRRALDTVQSGIPVEVSITLTSAGAGLPFTFTYTADVVRDSIERAFGVLRFSP